MAIHFTVTWANPGHALLPDALADVRVELAGEERLSPVSRALGVRRFTIPDGQGTFTLRAAFSASFEAFDDAPAVKEVVLEVEQRYEVDARGLVAAVASPLFEGPHPLVDTELPARPGEGLAAKILTDFVDIKPFWRAYADFADEHDAERDADASLAVLGYTGGDPKIWFASIPAAAAEPPAPGISCLVFYRPTGARYDRIDQKHDMFGLNRYLLKPTEDPQAAYWRRDRFALNPETGAPYCWLRCGFEDAMVRSGKPVVMLHPWPTGLSYGSAVTADLSSIAEAIVRFLWAGQYIAHERGGVHLGRLGLSAYSAGGLPLWEALGKNRARVDEVYAFDARGSAEQAASIAAWFKARPTARLRMTGAHQIDGNGRVVAEIQKALGPKAASVIRERVTSLPEGPDAYDVGVNPLWDHVLSDYPELRSSVEIRHQFAIFGGYDPERGPRARTSLQRFLEGSLF